MPTPKTDIKTTKIQAWSAVVIAIITALGGVATGYFGKQASQPRELDQALKQKEQFEQQLETCRTDQERIKEDLIGSNNALKQLKQHIHDVLNPKTDYIKDITASLERLKADQGVSAEHREQISNLVNRLNKIDENIMEAVTGNPMGGDQRR